MTQSEECAIRYCAWACPNTVMVVVATAWLLFGEGQRLPAAAMLMFGLVGNVRGAVWFIRYLSAQHLE